MRVLLLFVSFALFLLYSMAYLASARSIFEEIAETYKRQERIRFCSPIIICTSDYDCIIGGPDPYGKFCTSK